MTLQYHYTVPGDDFVHAGEASGHLKGVLRQLGYPGDTIRRVAISMYEGEINMVIHANGGEIDAEIDDRGVTVTLREYTTGSSSSGGSSSGSTGTTTGESKQFQDIHPVNHWAMDSIDYVTSRGLFNGKTEDTFAPEEATTRAQLMTVLARLDGADTTGAALEKGMAWAVANGISDGSNPNAPITRQQLAAMLYRYAGSPAVEGTLNFPDAGSVSDYAKGAMLWATQNGIINGKTDGRLDPTGLATRAQVATMIARYCAKLEV